MSRKQTGPYLFPPSAAEMRKSTLRPAEQWLIDIARIIGYGSLHRLIVHNGELVLVRPVRARRHHRLGKLNGWAPSFNGEVSTSPDFVLKTQQVDCIEKIRSIRKGFASIKIQDGLPVSLTVEEEIGI